MPEYVYALHDFLPEHEDEVSFHAGERIEVVEKDDLYQDGWWQGRNLAGKVGLFPQSYTAPAPPSLEALALASSSGEPLNNSQGTVTEFSTQPKAPLQPLNEEAESESLSTAAAHTIPLNGHDTNGHLNAIGGDGVSMNGNSNGDGEVMKATMTDVQKAIEQLGRARADENDPDGARSFSFASTGDDRDTENETDTDFDLDEQSDGGQGGEGWHKGARKKLAEKARRAVEEAEKLEMIMGGGGGSRMVAPPIEVEVSDESDVEDDHHDRADFTSHSGSYPREHPYIPEEDEEEDESGQQKDNTLREDTTVTHGTSSAHSSDHSLDLPAQDEPQTATATRTSFPSFQTPPHLPSSASSNAQTPNDKDPQSASLSLPTPVSPVSALPQQENLNPAHAFSEKRTSTPYRESLIALPSPTTSLIGIPNSKHSSVASSMKMPLPAPSPTQFQSNSQPPLSATLSQQPTLVEERREREKERTHPTEWTVEDVVDWLKGKGFDQDVCDKFTEQEITGDVLLELDVNLLKSEIGIVAFGKRMRIANAITDLRRPPSIVYSDLQPSPSSPMHTHSPLQAQSQSHPHSRNVSQSHSYSHGYSQSVQSSAHHSLNSPLGFGAASSPFSPSVVSPESAPHTGDFIAYGGAPMMSVGEGEGSENSAAGGGEEGVGLGIGLGIPGAHIAGANGRGYKNRPAQLNLSPSDGALHTTAKAVSDIPEEAEEERAVMSESEIAPSNSMRRRLFGRSHDSASSLREKDKDKDSKPGSAHSRNSREGVSPMSSTASPTLRDGPDRDKDKDSTSLGSRHARSKKSIDGGRSGDRLSLFGGTFGGTLGKSRKPPPRYSSSIEDVPHDKASHLSLSRLYGSKKSGSSRHSSDSSPKTSPKESKEKTKESAAVGDWREKEKEPKDSAVLRKRTSSAVSPKVAQAALAGGKNGNGIVSPLKAGQSILDQIGTSDHNGWMRKKSDRYNTWKSRYFVLKGPHLYCLRSNQKTETKIKGYVNIVGYKVTVDENVDPGRYGFRIDHEHDKTHYFSSEEKTVIRDWMKAIMKATIARDYTRPVASSCNIPTIPLMVAQAMNPAPRPPSPTARDATQKALRRENPDQLSSRDARVLMGLPSSTDVREERARLDSFFSNEAVARAEGDDVVPETPKVSKTAVPPRPSREMRRLSSQHSVVNPVDDSLIEWANSHLPSSHQITDPTGSLCNGLALLRLAESIKGRPSSPPVPDSAFPKDASDDKLDGLFRLFDFLLDNDVKMGSVSINDVRQGKREKIVQLLRALKAWEDKRKAIAQSIGKGSVQAGGFMAPVFMA